MNKMKGYVETILVVVLIIGLMIGASALSSSSKHDSIKRYVRSECLK